MKCRNCKHNGFLYDEDGTQFSWCEVVIDNLDIDEERECKAFLRASNADRIRAMTDEELAEYIDSHSCEAMWCAVPYPKPDCPPHETCKLCILDWLKSPVEVDE